MKTETIVINKDRNVTLTAYIQPVGGEFENIVKRPAILVLPGGGYYSCSDREADPIAFSYLKAGYQVFILRYSIGENAVWPNPLEDYEAAMELIRSRENEWKLYPQKVAVIGFSAGGHLAACAATMADNRPNAAILGYAVIDKETVSAFLPSAPDAAEAVDGNTCPCFLFASRTDTLVPVRNSLKMIMALMEYDISYESHIYAYGNHGFSSCDSSLVYDMSEICNRVPHWVNDSIEWLKDVFGDFADQRMTEPKCKAKINGNQEPNFNVECTMKYLMQRKEVMDELSPVLNLLKENMHMDELPKFLLEMQLKELLVFMKMPQEKIGELDEKLKRISN